MIQIQTVWACVAVAGVVTLIYALLPGAGLRRYGQSRRQLRDKADRLEAENDRLTRTLIKVCGEVGVNELVLQQALRRIDDLEVTAAKDPAPSWRNPDPRKPKPARNEKPNGTEVTVPEGIRVVDAAAFTTTDPARVGTDR